MKALRILVDAAAIAAALLAFGWPLAVSTKPDDALFKPIAIATLMVFLVSLAVLLAIKARR